jgi:hypothetical protein
MFKPDDLDACYYLESLFSHPNISDINDLNQENPDFSGHRRILFSLDYKDISLIEPEITLPIIVDLLKALYPNLEYNFCIGGYKYEGQTQPDIEFSFIIKFDETALLDKILGYLKTTRQESILLVNSYNLVTQHKLVNSDCYEILGYWREVDEVEAMKSVGFTKVNNRWFIIKESFMFPPIFLQIKEDSGWYCISSKLELADKFKFLIICEDENLASNVLGEIGLKRMHIPTINPAGYTEIDDYEYLLPTRVFKINDETRKKLSYKKS